MTARGVAILGRITLLGEYYAEMKFKCHSESVRHLLWRLSSKQTFNLFHELSSRNNHLRGKTAATKRNEPGSKCRN